METNGKRKTKCGTILSESADPSAFFIQHIKQYYSLAIEKSDNTAPAVAKLSGMMRYVIGDAAKRFVPLGKEISYIKNYIELQRIRLGNTIHLFFDINGDATVNRLHRLF